MKGNIRAGLKSLKTAEKSYFTIPAWHVYQALIESHLRYADVIKEESCKIKMEYPNTLLVCKIGGDLLGIGPDENMSNVITG